MDRAKIKEIVDRKRAEQNLSLQRLADAAQIKNKSHVSRVLNGQVALSRELLVRLARPLKCTKEELTELFYAAMYLPPTEEELKGELSIA